MLLAAFERSVSPLFSNFERDDKREIMMNPHKSVPITTEWVTPALTQAHTTQLLSLLIHEPNARRCLMCRVVSGLCGLSSSSSQLGGLRRCFFPAATPPSFFICSVCTIILSPCLFFSSRAPSFPASLNHCLPPCVSHPSR